jgi:hypothetical protein
MVRNTGGLPWGPFCWQLNQNDASFEGFIPVEANYLGR